MLKKLFSFVLLLILTLALVIGLNTWRKPSRQIQVAPLSPAAVDLDAVAKRLSQAVQLPTISSRDSAQFHPQPFLQLHALLAKQFPRVHAQLKRETVGQLSLLYTWAGSDPQAAPVLFMAHQDVVPIAPGTESDWTHPPFSGVIQDGFVWGRGSWDNKGNLLSQLEAVEQLLAEGYQPKRTLYLAFGADEEIGGAQGAAQIADLLKSRGVQLEFVIDEGLLVLDGVVPGLRQPAAMIGVAEKGYLSVRLKVAGTPGHSSMPPPKGEGVIASMSAALKQLDDHPMPGGLSGIASDMFETLAPEMTGVSRVVMSNLWLFGPLVQRQLAASASTNAMLRTTTALTIVNAGNKENVLPGRAEAVVNFRILPGDSVDQVMAHMRSEVSAVSPQFELEPYPGAFNASKVASTQSQPYRLLEQTIREVFPDAVVAPGLMVAGTDSKHFDAISRQTFKFSPIRANAQDLKRFHGTNERLSVNNYADAIRFYRRLAVQSTSQ